MQSQDIRQLVEKEGKSARNLVAWSVSAIDVSAPGHESNDGFQQVTKRTRRSRQRARAKPRGSQDTSRKQTHPKTPSVGRGVGPTNRGPRVSEEVCVVVAEHYSNIHAKQRNRQTKSSPRIDLHARYWSYLFDNLHRAVDELYATCEADESPIECQEVIMTLELCQKDFEALIRRFQLFEQQQLQPKRSNLAWEVRKTTSPIKLPSRRSLSPSASPAHRHYPHKGHTVTPSHHHPDAPTQLSQQSEPIKSLPPTNNVKQSNDTKKDHPVSNLDKPGPSTKSTITDNKTMTTGIASTSIDTTDTHPKPIVISRPSSARSLDFSSCTFEGRVYSPSQLRRSKSHGKADSEAAATKTSGDGLTWADRVRGRSKPVVVSVSVSDSGSVVHPESLVKATKDDAEEEGWERVARFRSKSASSGSKSTRNGNNKHKLKNKTNKLNENSSKNHHCSESSSNSQSGASSIERLTPVFDEVVVVAAESQGQEDTVLSSVGIETGGDKEDPVFDEVVVAAEEAVMEEEKKEIEVPTSSREAWTWSDVMADYEAGESYRQEVSWADRCDSPPEILSDIPRSPGRALHLHQRLSSPSRRRLEDVEESRRMSQEKQEKAEQHRYRLQEERTQKYKMASDKVRGARESRDARIRQQKSALEEKLQRAEMLRESHLQEIVRKAQEEDAKVSEISFINTLGAQNKKMEVLERHEVHRARLQELQDERQRKREEQLAKEEAAMVRRRMLESERVAKVMEQEVRRKEQEAKIEQMKQDRGRVREDVAREKARERGRKLEARNAAIQTSVEELERKIQQKQHESSRRYGQQLEQKKLVAVSVSRHTSSDDAPRVEVYKKKKWCTLCDVEIISEVYLLGHLRGRKHQEALASLPPEPDNDGGTELETPVIIEADEEQQRLPLEKPEVVERMKMGKKRAKKIRHRMASRVKEESWPGVAVSAVQSKQRSKMLRSIKELNRQLDAVHAPTSHTLTWEPSQITHIERCLGDLSRSLSSGGAEERLCFCQLGGLSAVMRLFLLTMMDGSGKKRPSDKALQYAVSILQSSCPGHRGNCTYLVLSNKMASLIDLSLQLLSEVFPSHEVGGASPGSKVTSLCGGLLGILAGVVSTLATNPREELNQPLVDLISYLVSVGLLDRLSVYFGTINGPIEDLPTTQLVLSAINLIVAVTASMHTRVVSVFTGCDDPSQLTLVLHQTELVGLMQLLYAILLADGPPRHSSTPPLLTQHTLAIATATIKAVNNSAILDLNMVQSCLGAEGISLEFRHVTSYLLWYCSHNNNTCLRHELILAVGYFCALNKDNQVFLQSGRSPTLLQLLCDLPFQYFSNAELTKLLFPTLILACYLVPENVCILELEISCKLLVAFLQEALAREESKGVVTDAGEQQDFSGLEHRLPRAHWEDAIKFFNR